MPIERRHVKLADLVEIKHGWPFQSEYISEELSGRPIVVNIGNFQYSGGFRFDDTKIREYRGSYPGEFELVPGDILLVMTCQTPGGEILGIPGRIPNDEYQYLHNQRMGKVVVKRPDLVWVEYLYWVFLSKEFNQELVATSSGTKILHTSPGRIEAVKIPLPSLPEQRAIARVLGALDDKIELNRRMNRTLEAMAAAIFKSWFMDFDPVVAKAEGRPPFGMDAETAALFPERFIDSIIGDIPKDWDVKPLDEIARYENGLALQKFPPKDEEFLPVIKIKELRQGYADSNSGKASPEIPGEYIVDDGDVIFSWSGSLLVDVWCGGRGALNQHLFKVTSTQYPKWFYYQWIQCHLPEFQRIAADKATTMGHIRRHHLSSALALAPPSPCLQGVHRVMHPLLEKVIKNRLQSRTLAEVRDSLLPRLLSGEIQVGQAEKVVESM